MHITLYWSCGHKETLLLLFRSHRTTLQKLKEAPISLKDPGGSEFALVNGEGTTVANVPKPKPGGKMNNKSSDVDKTTNDGGCTKEATLKAVLAETLGYGPQLSEHLIMDVGLAPSAKISKWNNEKFQTLAKLLQSLKIGWRKLCLIYDEYCPILLNQFKCRDFIKFDRFDASLAEFYSKIEDQHAEQQQKSKEGSAMQKLHKLRIDQKGAEKLEKFKGCDLPRVEGKKAKWWAGRRDSPRDTLTVSMAPLPFPMVFR
ncbi:hypothetical protein Ancab_010525 [Ancistrocladus abbreviatus]